MGLVVIGPLAPSSSPSSEPPPDGWLVWLIRLVAFAIAAPLVAGVVGLAVRIFRVAAGVE